MDKLLEFVNNIGAFKARAWRKRIDKEADLQEMENSLEWFDLPGDKRVALSFLRANEAADYYVATLSITRGTPDEWKPILLSAAVKLAGKPILPEIGGRCVRFYWKVRDPKVMN